MSDGNNFGGILAAAALVGLGNLLASKERLTWRIILGRALTSAGLGAASSLLMVWIPTMSYPMQLGAACLAASLGVSFLEKVAQRIVKGG